MERDLCVKAVDYYVLLNHTHLTYRLRLSTQPSAQSSHIDPVCHILTTQTHTTGEQWRAEASQTHTTGEQWRAEASQTHTTGEQWRAEAIWDDISTDIRL